MSDDLDDPNDRPTAPLRPSVQKLFSPFADAHHVGDAQDRIIEAIRVGIGNLIHRYLDNAGPVVRAAILHATHDVYTEGVARGASRAVITFQAYLDVLDRKYARVVHDPRADPGRPDVTDAELQAAIVGRGASLTIQEVVSLARECGLPLASANGVP